MPTLERQILADIAELYGTITEHLALDKGNCQKIEAMYKILVTGNGVPSLPETVRKHCDWIKEKDKEADEKEKRGFEYKKGLVLLVFGQLAAIGGSALAIWMGLKK